ncbi:MAG: hypothetical protein KDE58_36825, partial [Caldilineaceae bacterium]|nr:hypothetical protein [Caldilineaceae bacterium]
PDAESVFGYNRYLYSFGNPLNMSDPSGHVPCGAGTKCQSNRGVRNGIDRVLPSNESQTPLVQPDQQRQRVQNALPVMKEAAKDLWGCAIGNCLISIAQWTLSADVGGMWAPIGPAVRAQGSLAIDSDWGLAVIGSAGGGGSTPVVSGGLTATVTNAPSVDSLSGISVQAGGTIGTAFYAEGIAFTDSSSDQTYFGASVAPLTRVSATYFPPPIEGSVHGTVMHSSVSSINIIEMFFAPLEWFLGEE